MEGTVIVVCKNDFPEHVYLGTDYEATDYVAQLNKARGHNARPCFYHWHRVPVEKVKGGE